MAISVQSSATPGAFAPKRITPADNGSISLSCTHNGATVRVRYDSTRDMIFVTQGQGKQGREVRMDAEQMASLRASLTAYMALKKGVQPHHVAFNRKLKAELEKPRSGENVHTAAAVPAKEVRVTVARRDKSLELNVYYQAQIGGEHLVSHINRNNPKLVIVTVGSLGAVSASKPTTDKRSVIRLDRVAAGTVINVVNKDGTKLFTLTMPS